MTKDKPLIGLEIHVHLTKLNTKLFCSCPSNYYDKEPNSNVCPTCLGLPGALPVPNKKALEMAIMVSLALNCKLSPYLLFTRKHYFYPDMAKNYQISQYDGPGSMAIAKEGFIEYEYNNSLKRTRIRRINIEEDPAKITYPTGSILTSKYTLIDYNRSGIGMLEIVTEPDIREAKEARVLLDKMRTILEHLGVTDASLEGAMRADLNVSIPGGQRVEIKNVGSPKEAEAAINYEIARQRAALSQGLKVERETRHWDSERKITVPLRKKEEEEEYLYFPDPDLPPIKVDEEVIKNIMLSMPELPDARAKRFSENYGIDLKTARILVMDKKMADFFEETVKLYNDPSKIAYLLINEVQRWLNDKNIRISESKLKPEHIASILKLLDENVVTMKIIKEVILRDIIYSGTDPVKVIESLGLTAIRDKEELERIIDSVFSSNPKAVEDAKADEKAINYLVGLVMKRTGKRADPKLVFNLIKEK
jgi:glutamyl-tRNA(Gln) and/or aspartyl-tRNA(Asn) amidotransferase, B subunit